MDAQHTQNGIAPPVPRTHRGAPDAIQPDSQRCKQHRQTRNAGFRRKLKNQIMRVVVQTGNIGLSQHRSHLKMLPGELAKTRTQPRRLPENQPRLMPQIQADAD